MVHREYIPGWCTGSTYPGEARSVTYPGEARSVTYPGGAGRVYLPGWCREGCTYPGGENEARLITVLWENEARLITVLWENMGITRRVFLPFFDENGHNEACLSSIFGRNRLKRRLRTLGVRISHIPDIPGFIPPLCRRTLWAGFNAGLRRVLALFSLFLTVIHRYSCSNPL